MHEWLLAGGETNRPPWSKFAVGDAVEVRLLDGWERGEIRELRKLGPTYCYCLWLTDKKTRHEIAVSKADDFHGSLRRLA